MCGTGARHERICNPCLMDEIEIEMQTQPSSPGALDEAGTAPKPQTVNVFRLLTMWVELYLRYQDTVQGPDRYRFRACNTVTMSMKYRGIVIPRIHFSPAVYKIKYPQLWYTILNTGHYCPCQTASCQAWLTCQSHLSIRIQTVGTSGVLFSFFGSCSKDKDWRNVSAGVIGLLGLRASFQLI